MRTPARRRLVTISAAVISVVGFSVTSATASDPSEACNPTGRTICITTSDVDGITHSTAAVARSTVYSASVRNGGGSALTNVSATLKLVDVVSGVDGPSSGSFAAATLPSFCTLTTPSEARCPLPNLGAGQSASLGSFAARTSTNLAAAVMRLDVTVTVKERANDQGDPNDPNVDTFTKGEPTSLEGITDLSASMVYNGGSTVLDTNADGKQTSQFFVRVPAGFAGFQFTILEEFDPGDLGYFCPVEECFGQSVRVSAPGIFSATNPAELKSTVLLSLLKGVSEKGVVVHHDPFDGPAIDITAKCSGDIGTQPPLAEIPCRRVNFDRKADPDVAIIDAWDFKQGEWGFS
jgi:hypothetical protein